MSMTSPFQAFEHQQYLNLETFRKNGQGVKTPVWFAQEGDRLHLWTQADAGKAKRIRRNGQVRLVPSNGRGDPQGEWISGTAVVSDTPEDLQHTERLFRKKYGLAFVGFRLMGALRRTRFVTLIVEPAA